MQVLETERLTLRWMSVDDDAAFILRLVNEPSWLQCIGDKNIKTLEAARRYIETGPLTVCRQLGFGLFIVEPKDGIQPIGMCGLIKRDTLEDVDLGFAFLPEFWGKGYAMEAASATVVWGKATFGFSRLVAITSQQNVPSGKLLGKLGFHFERMVRLQAQGEELKLYAVAL